MAKIVSMRLRPSGTWFETILSGFVILVAVAFLAFVYVRTGTGHFGSYPLLVRLPSAAGLDVGKDVRVGGVKVGVVSRLTLDPHDYSVIALVSVRDDLHFPIDSVATVGSTIMGEVYLAIVPGHSARNAPSGGTIGEQPAMRRQRMVGS
jgi:phospholipid/cholesterol/gamma-HCH transport system substrate-binding protein